MVVEEGFGLGRRGDGLRGFYKERELWRGMEAGECRREVGDMYCGERGCGRGWGEVGEKVEKTV